jgi:hypothetical protein
MGAESRLATHVKQLTGKGVEGLEHCPPSYHVDFTPEGFERLVANPEDVFTELGFVDPLPGITVELARPLEGFSEMEGWVSAKNNTTTGFCCVAGADGGVKCHRHCG